MSCSKRPIAVIDSGLGGVSVLTHLLREMPNEDIIYFGDTLNAPYGSKTEETIRTVTLGNVRRLISDYAVKAVVIACNTATGASASACRESFSDIPIVGIEPAIKPAVTKSEKKNPRVLVMATPLTLSQEKFTLLAEKYNPNASIIALPCPGLSDLIEGCADRAVIKDLINTLLNGIECEKIDSIVLGCTHYPLVRDIIEECFPNADIYDGGKGTALQTKRRLSECGLCDKGSEKGKITFVNSAGDQSFEMRALEYIEKLLKNNMKKGME